MRKLPSLSILIQAYNNQDTIRTVLTEAVEVGQKYAKDFEIIVTDDGSTDATASEIRSSKFEIRNLKVITHKKNQGFGKTIKEQYYKAQKNFVFSIPGDRQIRASSIVNLMTKIANYDMVIGSRKKRRENIRRRFQSRFYNILLSFLSGLNLHDVNSSKLFRRKILDKIKLESNSAFVDAELCLKAVARGHKICEVEIEHYQDRRRKSGGGNLKTILPVIKDIVFFRNK